MKIDIVDLNYDICSKEWMKWRRIEKLNSKFKYPAFIEGLFRTFLFTFLSLRRINFFVRKKSVIFLVATHNQHNTLSKVADKTDQSILLGMHNFKSESLDGYIPSILFYFAGWIFFPYSIYQLLRLKDKYQRVALIGKLERVLVSGASVFVWKILFWLWAPKIIVISNDHNHWTRSAVRAAKEINLKTAYIPHSYTSSSFPELECSYSFLDSDVQRNLYKKTGINENSKIHVVGAVRYENKIRKIESRELNGILICFNILDSSEFIDSILKDSVIKTDKKYSIFVKPHPGDRERFIFIENLCQKYGLNYFSPSDDISDLSSQVQVLLGGITGAHIDAIMYGMHPLSFPHWYEEDYYGLIDEGAVQLVNGFSNIEKNYIESSHKVQAIRHRFNQHLLKNELLPSQLIANKLNTLLENA